MPPTSLIDSLHIVRRKVRALAIASGMSVAVAAAVGLLVGVVLIDWSLGLDKVPRLLLIAGAAAALLHVLWHWLAVPMMAKLNIGDVAGRLEHTFPQFDDRLRSTVNFVQGEIPGSRSMQERVALETDTLAQTLNLDRVIVRGPVYLAAGGAVASVFLLVGLLAWGGHNGWLGIAANRLMLGNDQWPKSVEIALDGPMPRRVAVGQRIPIKLHLAKGDRESRKATILYRYDNGPWQQEIMTRKDGVYSALLDARLEQGHKNANLEVRLESGDDKVALSAISVVPRLEIAGVEADVTPPPYVQPAVLSTTSLTDHPAVMVYGSTVGLRINFNKPLKDGAPIELRPVKEGQRLPAMQWNRSTAGAAVARFRADASMRFTVRATDSDGFQNAGGEEYEMIVKEDQPPTVQIEEPKRSEDRTPTAGFDVKAVAEDDYGIVGAQLIADRVSGGEKSADAAHAANPAGQNHWLIDLVKEGHLVNDNGSWDPADSSAERKRYRLGYHWELASLPNANLKAQDVLEFYVQVKDNFQFNGKEHDWVKSGKLRITIISPEEWRKQVEAAVEQIQQQIKAQRMSELRQKAEGETLKAGLNRNQKFDEADKAQANRLANDQASTQSQTMQLGDRLQQLVQKMSENKSPEGGLKQTADQVQKDLKQTADSPMREAKQNIDAAKDPAQDAKASADRQAKDARQRSAALDKAAQSQQAAADQLQKAMDKLGQMGGLPEAIKNIERIKAEQEKIEKEFQEKNKDNIGKKPDELSKDDQDSNKKQSDKQDDLAKQLEQSLSNMDAKADKMNKSDPSSSQAMKEAAQIGKQQGLSGKQQQAAQNMQQNQQAQAQNNQKQVELGLDQILNKLREAERKQLEELARQLSQMQQLIAELIQRQAGHNIDNLLIQGGPKRLEQVESKERDELIADSGRDPKNMPPAPQLTQLSVSQEQTQRNAVDIAKQAESLPDPAPATKLTEAAGHMERAIVHLRNNKLADAYKPPQADALATLLEAKKQIDAAAKKTQDKLDEKDAETIKQAYVELLKAQKIIGGDLKKVDGAAKDANGDLPREMSVKLAQLPGDQGKLIDKAQKIGEQLKQLDSIVYNWANKDILKSMGTVKDNLAKPETGKPTQMAETHTEDQLQAMIDSLVQKMRKSEFDQRNSGGGGGGGSQKPKLPTEAELRLLGKNQQAVNEKTIEADKQKEKDKEQLLALGGRQGEIRGLLDQLIQKASQGKTRLGPEPDPKDQLPGNASKEDVDNQEMQDDLLGSAKPGAPSGNDKSVQATGDRMARARQRLALNNDPGAVTQEIQKRISLDIDDLIKQAQQTVANKPKPGSGKGEKMGPPQPQPGQGPQQASKSDKPGQNSGKQAATDSQLSQGEKPNADLSGNVKEAMEEWGRITQRDRQAVQEGAGEQVIGKYKKFVEDYYRSLAEQASKR
ncbi:MAG TPA: DUF4175 family protein [Tepidisphaeraceae bacterium]|jgi:hypothetical protein|nr:DUF4175 family protein [Tepidisphaeraceae bacterium]